MRQIDWSGYEWDVRPKSDKQNPGGNAWGDTSKNVRVNDNGELVLGIWKDGSRWRCADVTCTEPLGYGEYRWEISSMVTRLDANAVLGLFTYDLEERVKPGYGEIDIEVTRWGDKNEKRNVWLTVQPDKHASMVLPASKPFTMLFRWTKGKVEFIIEADGKRVGRSELPCAFEPNDSTRAIMDLWLMLARPPLSGDRVSARIASFKHTG